jgi:hypothetical protein
VLLTASPVQTAAAEQEQYQENDEDDLQHCYDLRSVVV